jgi:carboxyl-terminal processing protease
MKRPLFFKQFVIGILIIFWLGLGFSLGLFWGLNQVPKPPSDLPPGVDLSVLWDVWRNLEAKYPGPLDYQQMIYGAAKGLVQSLKDPYTVFFDPQESKMFKEDISGSFEGVGMEIGMKNGILTVIAPLEGTPAKRAGILAGDKIVKIDGEDTRDITIDKAVQLIRGKKGTKVVLTILREDWKEPKDFEIIRDVIQIPSAKWELKEGEIAHITIYQFSENLDRQFQKIADEVLSSPAKKIILDLRNNPGGLLVGAQNIAGWFLERGEIVTIEKFGKNEKEKPYRALGNSKLLKYPIAILINQGTASGAEILAAAIRENRDDVRLIGEKSFGKGSVQEAVEIRGNSLLKVTTAHWLTPNGSLIDKIGLTPDIEVKMTEEDYKKGRDPQLEKAIEILKQFKVK